MPIDFQPVDFQPAAATNVDFQPVDFQPVEATPQENGPPVTEGPGIIGKKKMPRMEATTEEGLDAYRRLGRLGLGATEAGLNLLGAGGGMFVAPVMGALDALRGGSFQDTYEKAMQAAGSTGSTLADIAGLRTNEGDKINAVIGDVMNTIAMPLAGLTFPAGRNAHLQAMMPEAFRKLPKETGSNIPSVASILKDEPKTPPNTPPATPEPFVGPEQPGPYSELPPDLQVWKDRAAFLQKQAMAEQAAKEAPPPVLRAGMATPETEQAGVTVGTPEQMEGLHAATAGITYENVPPDAVIPRNAPTKGVEVPKKGTWAVGEDGIPYRSGFAPEHVFEPYGPHETPPMDVGARNDLGVALQYEANGPKLGVQDYWGSEPLDKAKAGWGQSPSMNAGHAGRQRGAINMDIFRSKTDTVKRIDDQYMLRFIGGGEPSIRLIDKTAPEGPKEVGRMILGHDMYVQEPSPSHNLETRWVEIDKEHRSQKLSDEMYKFANQMGNDVIRSPAQTPFGKRMWDRFEREGYTGKSATPGRIDPTAGIKQNRPAFMNSQSGKVDFQGIVDSVGDALKKVRDMFPSQVAPAMSAEELAARADARAKAQVASNVLKTKTPELYDPMSGEEAAAQAQRMGDIKSKPGTNRLASGLNFMASFHNNPLLKYARRVLNAATGVERAWIEKYVHGAGGTTEAMNALTTPERIRLTELINHLDKNQIAYTPEIGDKVGLTENAKKFMEAWNKAADAEWNWNKDIHAKQGVEQAPYRPGYAPSMYGGSYHAVVMQGEKMVGIIQADTPGDFFKAKQYYAGKYQGAKFSAETPSQARTRIGGNMQRGMQMQDIGAFINLLTNEDNSFSKVQQVANKKALSEAMNYGNFNYHNLAKSGIEGALGDRPWLSAERNANDRLSSMNRFLTDSARYHSRQAPIEELNQLMANPAFNHMPNAKEFLTTSLKAMDGRYTSDLGDAANSAVNMLTRVSDITPILNKVFGMRTAVTMTNAIKNRLSQMYMGWFNASFMAAQILQPVQFGIPVGMKLARQLGLSYADMAQSLGKGVADMVRFDLHQHGIWKSKDADLLDAAEFAKNHGQMDFTEGEHLYTGDYQGKLSRMADDVGNMSMRIGEHVPRASVFFGLYDAFKKAGVDKQNALEAADTVTNDIMGNYHPEQRALVYQGAGVAGPHMGALTTFKHNYVGQQVALFKDMIESKDPRPFAAQMAIALGLAGITGLTGYDELDTIYQGLRRMITGERRSIRQDFMSSMPEWLKTGMASQAVGMNVQNKFSMSTLATGNSPSLLEGIAKMASPYAVGAWDNIKSVIDYAKDPNKVTAANAAVQWSPQSTKQAVKAAVQRDPTPVKMPNGEIGYWALDKQGRHDYLRSESDWRKAAISGMTPIQESVERSNYFQNVQNQKTQQERQQQAVRDFQSAVATNDNARINKALKDYEDAGGYPPALIKSIGRVGMQGQMSSQQRAEGIPKSPSGINRYEEFQTK